MAPQDTKHINDASDPSAVEAKALSAQLDSADGALSPAGSHMIRLIGSEAAAAESEACQAGTEAAQKAGAAGKNRRRHGFVLHPLPSRRFPGWRPQR